MADRITTISERVARRDARIREVALHMIRVRGRVYSRELCDVLIGQGMPEELDVTLRVEQVSKVLAELQREGVLESELLTPPPAMQRRYYRLKQGESAHV